MKNIRYYFLLFLDFLFPKSQLVQDLESMSNENLVDLLLKNPDKFEPVLPDIISLFPYRDENVHELVHEIKYSANKNLASKIAPAIYNLLIKTVSINHTEKIIITFIPTTQSRKEKRGFDQGEIILNAIKKYEKEILAEQNNDDLKFEYLRNILSWNKNVTQQSLTNNKEERLRNMDHALIIKNPELTKNKIIVVIDDVCTTGATLYEARRALEDSGASHVYLITIAH